MKRSATQRHGLAAGIAWALLVIGSLAGTAMAQVDLDLFKPPGQMPAFGDSRDRVKVTAKSSIDRVLPGGDVPIAVVFEIDRGWHIWANDRDLPAGVSRWEFAILTEINVDDEAIVVDPASRLRLAWPDVHGVESDQGDGPVSYGVFEGRAIAYIALSIAADAAPGEVTIPIEVTYQTCDATTCLNPVDQTLNVTLEIVPAGTALASGDPGPDFAGFPSDLYTREIVIDKTVDFDLFGITFSIDAAGAGGLLLLLLIAAFGGMLLNFTPCVLPVIPIKIMGLGHAAAGSRTRTLALGISMFIGVVAFWLLMGSLIAGLTGFTAINQLFQKPLFTIGVGIFIAFMAIGMCGLFSVRLPQFVYLINPSHETLLGSFIFGLMTAILSTPCTAPFMGAAAAWAATQPSAITLGTFASIGAGMGAPYLVLSAFPQLVERMPRTGPASAVIKQVMGLLMLAAAAYFIGTGVSGLLVDPPAPPSRLHWWAVGALAMAAGLWLAFKTFRLTRSIARRIVFCSIGLLIFGTSLFITFAMTDEGPIDWVYYTPDRFAQAKREGQVVVMDFTAEWCLNCKALETAVLHNPRVVEMLDGDGVVAMKVDLTGNNIDGNQMLKAVDRLTIPLIVVFDSEGGEAFKSDFYTVDQILTAIGDARSRTLAKRP